MEVYYIPHNIKVFGNVVTTFPQGIGEAFDKLMALFPEDDTRPYYGLSECKEGEIAYIAAVQQDVGDDPARNGYKTYTVEKGNYLMMPVHNWKEKTATIKDVIDTIFKDSRAGSLVVEMYKDDQEMLCLVKMKDSIEYIETYNTTTDTLFNTVKEFSAKEMNIIPFKDSWTPAQVIDHITKSNNSIAKAMKLEGILIERDAAARVPELKATFLDYSVKFKSPDFIIPEDGPFERKQVVAALERSVEQLIESSRSANLSEAITHPAFGEITKLELLHFVLFHMQRHTHQLQNISNALKNKLHILN